MTETVESTAPLPELEVVATAAPPKPRWSRGAHIGIGVVVLAGLGVRIWMMTGSLGRIDSDEALTGLMARHLLDRHFAR